jgi:hypothetical protein
MSVPLLYLSQVVHFEVELTSFFVKTYPIRSERYSLCSLVLHLRPF